MPKQRRNLVIVVVVIAVVAAFFGFRALTEDDGPKEIPLDRYTRQLADGKVQTATVHDKDHTVTGELKNGTEYTVNFPSQYTARLTQDVVDAGVEKFDTDHQSQSAWLSLLYGLLPFVLLALVLMWVLGQVQGGSGRIKTRLIAIANGMDRASGKDALAKLQNLGRLYVLKERN